MPGLALERSRVPFVAAAMSVLFTCEHALVSSGLHNHTCLIICDLHDYELKAGKRYSGCCEQSSCSLLKQKQISEHDTCGSAMRISWPSCEVWQASER